jgi:hypothetical protein
MDDADRLATHIGVALPAAALSTDREARLKRDMAIYSQFSNMPYRNEEPIASTSESVNSTKLRHATKKSWSISPPLSAPLGCDSILAVGSPQTLISFFFTNLKRKG